MSSSKLTVKHERFGKCYSVGVSRLDGVSVFSLPDLVRLSIVLRQDEEQLEHGEAETLKLIFIAKYSNGLVKKIVLDNVPLIKSNFTHMYELVTNMPRLDPTELNYFDFDSTNFEFLEQLPQSSLRQYDFEIATNGKIVRLRAFQPVVENDVLKQVSTHAISFRARNLKRWQLIPNIKENKQERHYFTWTVKLSFLKICVLNFMKVLKCDFRVYFSEELNEVIFGFNHLGMVEFNTVLIGFNEQFNNILSIDDDTEVNVSTTGGALNEVQAVDKDQQQEDDNTMFGDDFGYTPAADSFSHPANKHKGTTGKPNKQQREPLFLQDDPTDEGSDEEAPKQQQSVVPPGNEILEDQEPEIQWDENTNVSKRIELTNTQIIKNAKAKYLKEQEKKRKHQIQREKEKRAKKAKQSEEEFGSQIGPTQDVSILRGLFD